MYTDEMESDPDAFAALFRLHSRAIYNYCFRRLADWRDAEDALSLVFLEAWRRRDKQLPPGKELPWLYGIATNVLRNRRRSERRFRAALARVPVASPEADFSDEAAERVDDERRMAQALVLLGQLSARDQDVFVLCAWQGLSYEDAALALAVPVGTVRSRLSRARERIVELDSGSGHEQDDTAVLEEAARP